VYHKRNTLDTKDHIFAPSLQKVMTYKDNSIHKTLFCFPLFIDLTADLVVKSKKIWSLVLSDIQ